METKKWMKGLPVILFIITGVEIWADLTDKIGLVYLTKPMLLLLLVSTVILYRKAFVSKAAFTFLLAALTLSLGGDIFLMIRETDLFVPGLASFLLAHVSYCFLFWKDIRRNSEGKRDVYTWQYIIVFLLLSFLVILLGVLLPHIAANSETKPLVIPVTIYAIVITTMGIFALLRRGINVRSFRLGLIGALFFIVSDTVLALSLFMDIIPYSTLWIMSTYVLAQYLITRSTLINNTIPATSN